MTSQNQQAAEEAAKRIAKERDNKTARWHKLRTGQATPEQAEACFQDLASLCFAGQCPAHLANYEPNRTFHFTGRQALWQEIQKILNNPTPPPSP